MKKVILFVCFIFFLFSLSIYGQDVGDAESVAAADVPAPVIVTPGAVVNLQWDSTDAVFAYMEKDRIRIRSSKAPYGNIGSVKLAGVLDYSMYHEIDSGMQLIAGASDGTMAVWSIFAEIPPPSPYALDYNKVTNSESISLRPDAPFGRMAGPNEYLPDFINNATSGRAINVLTFSEDSSYIAEHFGETGEIGMHFRLRYTSELVSRQVVGKNLSVYSMAFSEDKELLAAAGTDGSIRMWSSFSGRLLHEHSQYPESRVPIHFVKGTYNLLVAASPNRLIVMAPTGRELSGMDARGKIVDVKILSDKQRVAMLTDENRLELYRLEDGKYIGYIPSFNVTSMTSFDFNSDDSKLLMGHEDGSVYMVNLKAVVVAPRRAPSLRLISEDEVVVKGSEFTERIPFAEYGDTDPNAPLFVMGARRIFAEPGHSVDFLVGTTFLPAPFTMSLDAQLGYSNGFLLHPLYFGLTWRSSWGFPQMNFPYIYHHGDVEYDPPLLVDWVLEVPFGLCFVPWNFGLEIYAELAAGYAMHELWNRRLGNQAVTAGVNSGHFHGAFVTAVTIGFGWKGALLKVSGEWDSELGWTGQVSLGYSLGLPVPKKKEVR